MFFMSFDDSCKNECFENVCMLYEGRCNVDKKISVSTSSKEKTCNCI